MSKLFSDFNSVSKDTWLEKVEKDLKGKPISNLEWEWRDEKLTPFFHSEDITGSTHPISDKNKWLINEEIHVKSSKTANEQALKALEGGCTSLTFNLENGLINELDILLEGIQLEWIFTQWHVPVKTLDNFHSKFQKYIAEQDFDKEKVEYSCNSALKAQKDWDSSYYLKIDFENNDEILSIAEQISNYKQLLARGQSKCIICVECNDRYYENICKVRAVKKLIKEHLNSSDTLIQANIAPRNKDEDPNYRFIQSNAQALSSVIGGADIINIQNQDDSDFERRINRNVSHLLELESYMNKVGDPSAGSYFLEHMTNQIISKIKVHLK